MARRPEIGNIQLYPHRPLNDSDKNGYVLKFYCPILQKRIRRNAGTRDRREARRIMRECRDRLINGEYIESDGAISQKHATQQKPLPAVHVELDSELTWQECFERYYAHQKIRLREKSLTDATSRIGIAERILEGRREDSGLPAGGSIAEFSTLDSMEYLQDRLLAGDECRYDWRSPATVNSMVSAVMAFIRYCRKHKWGRDVPQVSKLNVAEAMKGRPITEDEFERMINAVPEVVGKKPADSWIRVLNVLWQTAFRVSEAMDFHWDDSKHIHPVWPTGADQHPLIHIPSSQKNKKVQQIPMLPGLEELLKATPETMRKGWVVNPFPIEKAKSFGQFRPTDKDLQALVSRHSNSAIARACNVSETAVRKWLQKAKIERREQLKTKEQEISENEMKQIRDRADQPLDQIGASSVTRLTKERVGRIISKIGEAANIIVQDPDDSSSKRLKYASAHDIRRGCAKLMINAGVSAETLKLVLRHQSFGTTERHYGATREIQSAAGEVWTKLKEHDKDSNQLNISKAELLKLKSLLNSL